MTRRLPELRERALKAHRLASKNITGDELAARLKVDPGTARDLVRVGGLINYAELFRFPAKTHDRLKVIARVIARKVMLGFPYAKTSEVDFAAGKRSGWCSKAIIELVALGLIMMPDKGKIALTPTGWAFVWETGLIKPNWKVPA